MPHPPFQVILQHELSGEPIAELLASFSTGVCLEQHALRLPRRETFIPDNHWHCTDLAQTLDKGESFSRLDAQRAIHVLRQPDHDSLGIVLAHKPAKIRYI